MAALKVAYGYPISQTHVDRLNALPGVELFDLVGLLKAEKDAASEHGPDSPEATAARQSVDDVISQIEIYYSASLPGGLPKRAPNLKWLQYVWDGIDLDVGPDILESPIVITNARQLSNRNIAEWVMMCILMFSKKQPRLIAERRDKVWSGDFYDQMELEGQTVGVVGLGAIGGDVARLSKAFGMTVLATRRTVTARQYNVGDVDEVMPASELDDLLKRSDYIALCVPGTPGTRQLITERELDLMGPTSFLINIARGSVVDEDALTRGPQREPHCRRRPRRFRHRAPPPGQRALGLGQRDIRLAQGRRRFRIRRPRRRPLHPERRALHQGRRPYQPGRQESGLLAPIP